MVLHHHRCYQRREYFRVLSGHQRVAARTRNRTSPLAGFTYPEKMETDDRLSGEPARHTGRYDELKRVSTPHIGRVIAERRTKVNLSMTRR